jgi:hypothetical protein
VATVDCVDRVIHRSLHHPEAQHRHRRRLPGVHDYRRRRDRVPVGHGIRARHRGRSERDERQYDEKWQNWYLFKLRIYAQNVALSFHTSSPFGERQRAGRMFEIKKPCTL